MNAIRICRDLWFFIAFIFYQNWLIRWKNNLDMNLVWFGTVQLYIHIEINRKKFGFCESASNKMIPILFVHTYRIPIKLITYLTRNAFHIVIYSQSNTRKSHSVIFSRKKQNVKYLNSFSRLPKKKSWTQINSYQGKRLHFHTVIRVICMSTSFIKYTILFG